MHTTLKLEELPDQVTIGPRVVDSKVLALIPVEDQLAKETNTLHWTKFMGTVHPCINPLNYVTKRRWVSNQ